MWAWIYLYIGIRYQSVEGGALINEGGGGSNT